MVDHDGRLVGTEFYHVRIQAGKWHEYRVLVEGNRHDTGLTLTPLQI